MTIHNFCDAPECAATTATEAATMAEAIIDARKKGWDVTYHGSGHGWLAFCPDHEGEAPSA
jgi:hypothetical protein